MDLMIKSKIGELGDLCEKRRVRRLALFGSAASDRFGPVVERLGLARGVPADVPG